MNTNEREAFEVWLFDVYQLAGEWNEQRNCYEEFACHMAWNAWQARAQLQAEPGQEPAALVRENPDDYGTIIEELGDEPLPVGTLLYTTPPTSATVEAVEIRQMMSADGAWIVGAQFGWSCGQLNDSKTFNAAIEANLRERKAARAELRAIAAQQGEAQAGETPVERYDIVRHDYDDTSIEPHEDGDYVRYQDYQRLNARLQAAEEREIGLKAQRHALESRVLELQELHEQRLSETRRLTGDVAKLRAQLAAQQEEGK